MNATRAAVLIGALLLLCCESNRTQHNDMASTMSTRLQVTPGKSIGDIVLGVPRTELPQEVRNVQLSGEHQHVRFMIENDGVSQVWMEDLRSSTVEVSIAGKLISKDVTLADLLELLGPCEREDRKGGVAFHCSGLTIGTDFDGKGEFLQVRLRPLEP